MANSLGVVFPTKTAAQWAALNPLLMKGQGAFEEDTRALKVGDGSTLFNDLPYFIGAVQGLSDDQLAGLTPGTFDVTKYGAVGNGIHDDTDGIMEAINAAHEAGGGTVVFPAGNYRVWDSIGNGSELISNVKLTTSGVSTARILANGNFAPLAGAFYRCLISGLTLDAGGHGAPAANIHMVETTLADCVLDGWTGSGLRLNDGTYGDVGLLNYVVRNHIVQNTGTGIFQTYRWVDSWIVDNNIGSTDANLSLEGGPLRVLGNHLNGAPLRNIELRGNKRVIISNNILEGSREEAIRYLMPSWLTADSPQVVISNNNFSNGGKAAAGVHPCIRIKGVSAAAMVEGFSIVSNLFACEDVGSGWSHAVLFENAKDSVVSANQWQTGFTVSPIGKAGTTSGIEVVGNTSGNGVVKSQDVINSAYGTGAAGQGDRMWAISSGVVSSTLALRGTGGVLNVGTAQGDTHATTKLQMDNADRKAVLAEGAVPLVADRWYVMQNSGNTTRQPSANGESRFGRFVAGRACTLVEIGLEVTVAGSAGSLIRFGVYAYDPETGTVGALLVDAGTVEAETVGFKTKAISVPVTVGQHFLAGAVIQGNPATRPTFRALNGTDPFITNADGGSVSSNGFQNFTNNMTGALPGTPGFGFGGGGAMFKVMVKAS
ncbi:hydrolase [Gordonia phage MerCougar]|nr:hydrolase [Gordonia phage MerCougar]